MRRFGILVVALAALVMVAPSALAQDREGDRNRMREELIERLDRRIEKLRADLIEEIDRRLDRAPRRLDRPERAPRALDRRRPMLGITLAPLSEGARTLLDLPDGVGVPAWRPTAPGTTRW